MRTDVTRFDRGPPKLLRDIPEHRGDRFGVARITRDSMHAEAPLELLQNRLVRISCCNGHLHAGLRKNVSRSWPRCRASADDQGNVRTLSI